MGAAEHQVHTRSWGPPGNRSSPCHCPEGGSCQGGQEQGSVSGGREAQAEPQVPWGQMGWPALLERNLESSPELSPSLM